MIEGERIEGSPDPWLLDVLLTLLNDKVEELRVKMMPYLAFGRA